MSVCDVGKMSAAEMDMWMIRAGTQPFTARRIEVGLAQIALLLHNSNCKKGAAKNLADFLLFDKHVAEQESIDQQIMKAFEKIPKAKAK